MAQFDSKTKLKTEFSFIEKYVSPNPVITSDLVGATLDNSDKDGTFILVTYSIFEVQEVTFVLTVNSAKLEHSDDGITYVEVPSNLILGDPFPSLIGTFTGVDPNVLVKIGYVGTKRFTRLVLNRSAVYPDLGATDPFIYAFLVYDPSVEGSLET